MGLRYGELGSAELRRVYAEYSHGEELGASSSNVVSPGKLFEIGGKKPAYATPPV